MARLAFILVVVASIVGCSAPDPTGKLPAMHGQSREQVVSQLGRPQRADEFPMSRAIGEFRIELQNTYPLGNPTNADVRIEELTWRDGDHWITLWLHQVKGQWVVLESCRWHKDVVF
jgi:hypothetical protein